MHGTSLTSTAPYASTIEFGDHRLEIAIFGQIMSMAAMRAKEIIVFPDGRAIIKNTVDESAAKELYARYVGGP